MNDLDQRLSTIVQTPGADLSRPLVRPNPLLDAALVGDRAVEPTPCVEREARRAACSEDERGVRPVGALEIGPTPGAAASSAAPIVLYA